MDHYTNLYTLYLEVNEFSKHISSIFTLYLCVFLNSTVNPNIFSATCNFGFPLQEKHYL